MRGAYRIGEVIQTHLHEFLPQAVRMSDIASEMYRNRVHDIGARRNSEKAETDRFSLSVCPQKTSSSKLEPPQ